MNNPTWNCEICGTEREDKFISVLTYPIKDFAGAERNLKYCNDKPNCLQGAVLKGEEGKF